MKKKLLIPISVILSAVMIFSAVTAFAANQKADTAIVLRSLMNFANTESYTMSGEMTITSKTNFLGVINEDVYTVPVAGVFAEGRMSFKSGQSANENSILQLIRGVERSMLSNLIIIDDFATGGTRYLDIAVLDFAEMPDIAENLRGGIADALVYGQNSATSAALKEIIVPLLNSLEVEGIEYFRINTKTRCVVGIGLNISLKSEFNLMDTPIMILSKAEAYIEIIPAETAETAETAE